MDVDSMDWTRKKAPFIASFEDSLRCNICKEIYKAPVITGCSHTFCSLCIRRLLQVDSSCPLCRATVQGSTLRKNQAVEDIVEQWLKNRDQVLKLVGEDEAEVVTESCEIGSPKHEIRRSKRQKLQTRDADDIIEISSSPEPDSEYSTCPVCGKYLKVKEIESSHIAVCLAERNNGSAFKPASTLEAFTIPKTSISEHSINQTSTAMKKKLAVANYSLMKLSDVKKVLREAGLSTSGTKQEIEERHREWVTIWNANSDLKNPESKSELRRRLEKWEKTARSNVNRNDGSIKDISNEKWSIEHKNDFADLIIAAKRGMEKKRENVSS